MLPKGLCTDRKGALLCLRGWAAVPAALKLSGVHWRSPGGEEGGWSRIPESNQTADQP